MEKVVEIIWDITKYLCGCAKQQVDFIRDLEENLQSLKVKWEKLEAMKNDVEERIKADEETGEMKRTHEVTVWLKSIQDAREEITQIQVQGAHEIQNKCLGQCCPKNCMSSNKLGKNVVKMLTKVDNITIEGQRACKDYQITQKLPHKPIDQIPLGETVGLDFVFDKVWHSIAANEFSVIGLYGAGGVGKTTLLKKINNELANRRPDLFVIWVVVSKDLNLDKIMDSIRKSIRIEDTTWSSCNSQEEKSAKILGVLKQKKFVLLLDDVWEKLDLTLVGVPHPKCTNFEFKVLFTTRLEDVCEKMKAQMSFKVEFLKDKEALELFRMTVGEKTFNSHPRVEDLAKEMVAECKGLPLALVVLGSYMAGVPDVASWEDSKNNLASYVWSTSGSEESVFSILKWSYDRLPNDVYRNCFLYCALYPEDYEIQVTDIIDKWIGEGFLCKDMTNNIQDIHNYGQSVIAKLKLCCLLESVEDDLIVRHKFKMHDMLRDMALWLARDNQGNKKFLVQGDAVKTSHGVEKWNNVERISIMAKKETWEVPRTTCPNLVTLLLRSCGIENLKNIKYMSKLKVLELNTNTEVNLIEIDEPVLLEYLSLQINQFGIEYLYPKELKNLKVFNLYLANASIESIPSGAISSLQQLRVLRVSCAAPIGANGMAEGEFLEEVESLPKIEELNVEITTKNGLNKLLYSNKLQNCVCALRLPEWRNNIIDEMPSSLACISKMKRLRQFGMWVQPRVKDFCIYDTTPLTMLQCVSISSCDSLTHVTWLTYAPSLQLLVIYNCESMEQVIEEEATKDENVDSSNSTLFSSLVQLILYEMPKLQSIHKTALSFPSLKAITITDCPNLKKLPLHYDSAKHMTLIQGEQEWWNSLEWDDPSVNYHFQSKFQHTTWRDNFNLLVGAYKVAEGRDWISWGI